MEIFDDWKFSDYISFQGMEIVDICDEQIRFFLTFPMKLFGHFKVLRLYSVVIYISTSLSGYVVTKKISEAKKDDER
jgi:hypothetical protein